MANIKFSGFDGTDPITSTSILVAAKGTNNIKFTPTELAPLVGIYAANGTLSSNRTITMDGKTLAMSSPGGNTVTFGGANNSGMIITGGNNYIVSSNGTYAISSIATSTSDAIVLRTSANASADTSILIDSRSPGGNADLHLKTATKLKIDLPVAAAVGYVLKADDVDGNVSWDAETDTGVTGVTLAVGTGQTSPLTESITNRELTITSNKYGGASEIGYVPDGGSNTTFLRGDGTWVTPTDTQNTTGPANPSATISGTKVDGSATTFMRSDAVPALGSTITIGTAGTTRGIVSIEGGGSSDAQLKLHCSAGSPQHAVTIEGPQHSGGNNYIIKLPHGAPALNKILKVGTYTANAGTYTDPSLANMIWADDADTSIYAANGNLTADRTVTMNNVAGDTPYNLTFVGITTSKVTFSNLGGVEIARDLTVQKNVIIQGQGYSELHTGVTTATFDWNAGNVQSTTLGTGTVAFAPTNAKAGATYIISIAQTGAAVINWGSYVKWPSTGEPTLSGNAKTDIVTLICYDDSVGVDRYYGSATLGFTS